MPTLTLNSGATHDGNPSVPLQQITQQIELTGDAVYVNKVTISHTSATTITFGGITTYGIVRITNLDPDNYVDFGITDASHLPLRFKPGELFEFRLVPGITFVGLAHTADVQVGIQAYND